MTNPTPKTPAWLIERLALGELDKAAAEEVRARLRAEGSDPDQVLAAIAASNREVLASLPTRQVTASIRARLEAEAKPRRGRALVFVLPAMGVALGALVLLARPPGQDGGPIPPVGSDLEETQIKGTQARLRLVVYRHGADRHERLAEGARAARGDLLQLAYLTPEPGFGVMVSLDGAGHVTVHLPQAGGAATAAPLKASREVRLPSSYELDDAPAFERFFLVTAKAPFAVGPVVQAAQALAGSPAARVKPLPLPGGFSQTSVRIDKAQKELP